MFPIARNEKEELKNRQISILGFSAMLTKIWKDN
jgi:hypothetical protein